VYQLWLIGDDQPQPAGTFTVTTDKVAMLSLTRSALNTFHTVGVTVEPFGGSQLPTSDLVMVGQRIAANLR